MSKGQQRTEKIQISFMWLAFSISVVLPIVLLSLKATYSSLWLDEAVEYWFSKEATGMYEKILRTYQPPLYNWIMHAWLSLLDSEFAFRFAGIVITAIGSAGLFFAFKDICNWKWAIAAMNVYIYSVSVMYYALECAEYNLMLCFVCWMLCYFIKYINRHEAKALICFYIFAILSVYSQYGAAFLAVGLFAMVMYEIMATRDAKQMKINVLCICFTMVIATLPLIYYFLIPQMEKSCLAAEISHIPDSNILTSFFDGIKCTIQFCLALNNKKIWIVMIPVNIICITAMIIQLIRRDRKLILMAVALLITYVLYWLACIFKLYAYNSYTPNSFGNRYVLFMTPMIITIYIYSCWSLFIYEHKLTTKNKLTNWAECILILILVCFCSIGIVDTIHGFRKDNIREIVNNWYDNQTYNYSTVLYNDSEPAFQYYLQHDDRYDEKYQEAITKAEVNDEGNEFADIVYYIAPSNMVNSENNFSKRMRKDGYLRNTIIGLGETTSVVQYILDKPEHNNGVANQGNNYE